MSISSIPHFNPFDFPGLSKSTVGFDSLFKKLGEFTETIPKIPTYPPYNIKKVGDNKYIIEIAVAGFGKQDLELELLEGTLTVKGQITADAPDTDYIFKGIADRAFTRKFSLADSVEIKNADLMNGMLKIWLERFIPEEKKAKKININGEETSSTKEFLTEKTTWLAGGI